jgi:IS5 family transposase
MKNTAPKIQQSFLYQGLEETLNPRHPLYKLSKIIPWKVFDDEFSKLYTNFGRPGKPIRLLTSLLILKNMYNLSDEELVCRWLENPYWQHFSGEIEFQWNFPCDSSELTVFRNRIGVEGAEKIFEVSVKMHGKQAMEKEIIADTTAQEKNITYPTDTKLHLKIISWVWRTAEAEGIILRQSYKRSVPKLQWNTRYLQRPKRAKVGRHATRKLKTIAGRLYRDIERKMNDEQRQRYKKELETSQKILHQKKTDKHKIYSFHEPEVSCIAKGKPHKKYEFGSKVSVLITKSSSIIVGGLSFNGNPYDGNTLGVALNQYERLFNRTPEKVLVDEGYRGKVKIGETEVLRVHKSRKAGYSKRRWRSLFRRRSAIEPVIGHLKQDHRLGRNFLKGIIGDTFNLLMACAAFNIKKLMRKISFILSLLEKALFFFIVPYKSLLI